jgi:hypothetical protein
MQEENNDNLIYHKDLSPEQIQELESQSKSHQYEKNCITSAFFGSLIAIIAALLLGISLSIVYLLVVGLGAGAGYGFYALGKYLEEKEKDDSSKSSEYGS